MSISIDCVNNIKEILECGEIISIATLADEFSVQAIKLEDNRYRLMNLTDNRPVFITESSEEVIFNDIDELVCLLNMIECEDIKIN